MGKSRFFDLVTVDSLIAIFDDGDKGDTYSYMGTIDSDVVAIFKFENFIPFSKGINIPDNRGLVIFEGEVASKGGAVMQLKDEFPLFFDCAYRGISFEAPHRQ
jgi:hypothetical protein